jgi:hypothetical protein
MTKYIIISEDGFEWACLLSAVADHRAKYYASKGEDYQTEYDLVMNEVDGEEAMDWLANNMNWGDINPLPRLIMRPETPDEPDDLSNADMDLKEVEGGLAYVD